MKGRLLLVGLAGSFVFTTLWVSHRSSRSFRLEAVLHQNQTTINDTINKTNFWPRSVDKISPLRNESAEPPLARNWDPELKDKSLNEQNIHSDPPQSHWSRWKELLQTKFLVHESAIKAASDVAHLEHCPLDQINAYHFSEFLAHLIPWKEREAFAEHHKLRNESEIVHGETILQALELYANAHRLCNFSLYHASVPKVQEMVVQMENQASAQKLQNVPVSQNPDWARIAFVIVAFNDFEHLKAHVQAIHLPHHLIVIHIERRSDPTFTDQVLNLTRQYNNVVALQFGSVLYQTDLVSDVNLRISRWLIQDLGLKFDQLVMVGASSFPLVSAEQMALFLKSERPRVRMGTMIYGRGARLCGKQLHTFGMIYTRGQGPKAMMIGGGWPVDRETHWNSSGALEYVPNQTVAHLYPPKELVQHCTVKSNSGNTASYDFGSLTRLLNSPGAMQFMRFFLYTSGCCKEESNWYAALRIAGVNHSDIALPGWVWQSWPCRGGMQNSLLSISNNSCYRIADSAIGRGAKDVRGGESLKAELKEGVKRGHLYARKFSSTDPESLALRQWIENTQFEL